MGEIEKFSFGEIGAYCCVFVSAGIREDVLDSRSHCADWVHERVVVVVVVWNRDVFLLILLLLEKPGYPVGVGEIWVVVGEFFVAGEETDVPDAGE